MNSAPRRSITIADVMILVAATAGGSALSKTVDFSQHPSSGWGEIINRCMTADMRTYPFLLSWAPTVLILGLVPPRPRLRKIFRQPGMVACGSATLAIAIELIPTVVLGPTIGVEYAIKKGLHHTLPVLVLSCARYACFSIVGAWATLALSRTWRRGRTWIDRLGTVLGIAFIAGQLFEQCCVFLWCLLPLSWLR
jgi:hypothetical protein